MTGGPLSCGGLYRAVVRCGQVLVKRPAGVCSPLLCPVWTPALNWISSDIAGFLCLLRSLTECSKKKPGLICVNH